MPFKSHKATSDTIFVYILYYIYNIIYTGTLDTPSGAGPIAGYISVEIPASCGQFSTTHAQQYDRALKVSVQVDCLKCP